MAAPHQKPFAKLVANNVFQLLVLSKDAGFCPDGISSEARPLFDSTLGSESVRFVPPELVESKLRALLK
jgi:hypothetical protein